MKNFKTTIGGIMASVGLGLTTAPGLLHTIGICMAAVGSFLTGAGAKDHNN